MGAKKKGIRGKVTKEPPCRIRENFSLSSILPFFVPKQVNPAPWHTMMSSLKRVDSQMTESSSVVCESRGFPRQMGQKRRRGEEVKERRNGDLPLQSQRFRVKGVCHRNLEAVCKA